MGICGETPPVSVAGFILTIVSFIIHLIGLASPFWNYKSNLGLTQYNGLWQHCVSGDKHTNCTSLTCDDGMDNPWCTSAWKATQALEILGLLSLFVTVVMVLLQMLKFKDRRILKLAGICCSFIGGILILIGVIVYGTQEGNDRNTLHFAFAFCILAAIGSVTAAIVLIIGHRLAGNADSTRMETGLSLNTIEQNARNDELAGNAESKRMDTGPSLNTIEQNANNDESAGNAESKRMDTGPSLNTIEQNANNDESDNEDQIALRELDENQKSAVEELKDNIEKEGLYATFKHFKEDLDKWRNEPVKLALTGKSGVGKSSFINAIRNLKTGDPGFATTSSYGNTTKHATVFEYPGNPKITLHDLPGFGTTKFPKNEYEEQMELHKYDYILIFVGNIEENDIEIAKKLKEMGKPFCFVRSKLDLDIENAKNDGEPEAEAIQKIMSKSEDILLQEGFREASFFVISNRNRRIGHFNKLVSYIQSNLPKLKCDAVMFSLLGELSDDIINSKYQILKDRQWKVALASAAIAATPVPGVDVAVNVACICNELFLYYNTFGFGQQIVIDISNNSDLRKKLSASSIIETVVSNKTMATFVFTQLGTLGKLMAIQSGLDFIWPILGSVVSGLTAGTVTYNLLTRILDGCRDDAKLVYSHLMTANAQN